MGGDKSVTNRISPYEPSFRRQAAKMIDPTVGASTWAFGNHTWKKNTGNFTQNTINTKKQKTPTSNSKNLNIIPLTLPIQFIKISHENIGNERIIVYTRRKLEAENRSPLFPDQILELIGRRINSNTIIKKRILFNKKQNKHPANKKTSLIAHPSLILALH